MLETDPNQVHYFFCLFNKHVKHCKNDLNKQYFTCSLNAWMGYSTREWCIKYGAIKTTEKLLQSSK